MGLNTIVVIPARMASSRFPGKPLVKILDLPMIEHVRRRALLAEGVDEVVVATCDHEIYKVVTSAGGVAVITADTHERSTERVAEVMTKRSSEVVAIVQGDEPLVRPKDIETVIAPFSKGKEMSCVSLLSPLESTADYNNSNIVKTACDQQGTIMYFSRAPIPHYQRSGTCPIYRETGIRAFRSDFLNTYIELPETPFERVESVDMMRVLEHGYKIHGVATDYVTIGVDHAKDVEVVERILSSDSLQGKLHAQITTL